jgi:hypothetical protein
MTEIQDLPRWVWDLLADLIVEDDTHPTLYFTSGGFQGHRQYDWCPNVVLEKIPTDVLSAARVIAGYRRPATEEACTCDGEWWTGDHIATCPVRMKPHEIADEIMRRVGDQMAELYEALPDLVHECWDGYQHLTEPYQRLAVQAVEKCLTGEEKR